MLAKAHITPRGINRVTIWPVTLAKFALEALNSTASPRTIRASTMPSSTPSTCRVRRAARRLTAVCFVVILGCLDGLRHLAEQVVVEHLARDRRSKARPETRVLDDHGERDPRL